MNKSILTIIDVPKTINKSILTVSLGQNSKQVHFDYYRCTQNYEQVHFNY